MASNPPAEADAAPPICLPDHNGDLVTLASMQGRKALVYFYPRADTPGCTTQACALRDIAEQIGDTAIVGISPDEPARLARFRNKYELGFTLLADVDHAAAEAYGVWVLKKNYGREYFGVQRSAFLVAEDGTIARAWPKISPKDTPVKLLEALSAG